MYVSVFFTKYVATRTRAHCFLLVTNLMEIFSLYQQSKVQHVNLMKKLLSQQIFHKLYFTNICISQIFQNFTRQANSDTL